MRISLHTFIKKALFDIWTAKERLFKVHEHLSSGKRLTKPSDDPIAIYHAENIKNDKKAISQYSENIADAIGWMRFTESVLDTLTEKLTRAKQLALQGSNDTYTTEERQKIAEEVNQILENIYAMSNTRYKEKYIFGGTETLTEAYSAVYDPVTGEITDVLPKPAGITGQILREINENEFIVINLSGEEVFSGPDVDIFDVLIDLRDSLRTDDINGIKQAIEDLETALNQVLRARTKLGGMMNRLENCDSFLKSKDLSLEKNLSQLEDADIAEEVIMLEKEQMLYQMALAATQKVLSLSLTQFIV